MARLAVVLLVYCVLCWFAAAWLFRIRRAEGEGDVPATLTYVRLGLILMAPLYIPCVAGFCLSFQVKLFQMRRRVRMLRRINRTVREFEFLPVDGSSLGEPTRGHLDRLTPPLLELGFQPIGDFRMKPEPVVVYDRILLSEDGRTLATVCCVLRGGAVGFTSLLDDGTLVHTTGSRNTHPERTLEPADQLVLTYMPDTHPSNQHRQHQEAVRAAAARTGAQVMQLRPDQFREVMVYDQRIFNRWRRRHGSLDREPPAPDFSTLLPDSSGSRAAGSVPPPAV
jgi:hypothetical protein